LQGRADRKSVIGPNAAPLKSGPRIPGTDCGIPKVATRFTPGAISLSSASHFVLKL
jgi:hypothetical protein